MLEYFLLFSVIGFSLRFIFKKIIFLSVLCIIIITLLWGFIYPKWMILTCIELLLGFLLAHYIIKEEENTNISNNKDNVLKQKKLNIEIIEIEKNKENHENNSQKIIKENNLQLEYKNTTDYDKYLIKNSIQERNIDYLFHFTQEKNISSILKFGLLPRSMSAFIGIGINYNDSLRLDNREDYNSLSISFPNSRMFYKYRKLGENKGINWAIIVFNPEILYLKTCLFCQTNAANTNIRNTSDIQLKNFSAFEALFKDELKRKELNLPSSYPTDEQAEVLVNGIIEPKYIHSIAFNKKDLVYKYKSLFPEFDIRYDNSIYNSRSYFLNSLWRQ